MSSEVNNRSKSIFSIGNKIFGSFLVLILLFAANAAIIFTTVSKINSSIITSSEVINPSREAINEMISLVHKSRMLITNWVYLQTNEDDKETFRKIVKTDYPELKERLDGLMKNWEADTKTKSDSTPSALMQLAIKRMDVMLAEANSNIVGTLTSFDDYEDPTTKLLAADFIDQRIVPESAALISLLQKVQEKQNLITEKSEDGLIASARSLSTITLLVGAGIIVIGIVFATLLSRAITKPINYIKDVIVRLGKGELVEDRNRKFNRDEIGEMAASMTNLVDGLKATSLFAENIGKGKYDSDFKPLSEQDVLGHALLDMRANLAGVAAEDKKRNWATEGLARFGEVLRTNNNDLAKLSDEIISNLVKYLKANQGAIYVIDDVDSDEDQTMTLKACYAWNRKKYLEQKIHLGEGLAGQAWQERDTIYLTDVPQNYIRITSGLGESNPTCVLIVPLKVNDEIYGVVELASLTVLHEHEVDFVQKISESIASTISSAKVNVRTKRLLEESQMQAEQMRAQEEEMRQNMEELSATQEEVHRILTESQKNEAFMTSLLNSTNDSILTIDRNYKIISCNKTTQDTYKGYGMEIGAGTDIFSLFKEDQRATYKQHYDRAFAGEFFEVTEKYSFKGRDQYFMVTYSPLRDNKDNIVGVAAFGKDVTDTLEAKNRVEQLLNDSQQQTEELKSQEEELRQNMEELSATQEEMHRILQNVQSNEQYLKEVLDSSKDTICTLDKNFKLISFNKGFEQQLSAMNHKVEKGFDILSILEGKEREKLKSSYNRVLAGEHFETLDTFTVNGGSIHVENSYSPLRNDKGEVYAIVSYSRDVTEVVNARKLSEKEKTKSAF